MSYVKVLRKTLNRTVHCLLLLLQLTGIMLAEYASASRDNMEWSDYCRRIYIFTKKNNQPIKSSRFNE